MGYLRYYASFDGIRTTADITEDGIRGFLLHGRVRKNWKHNSFVRCYHNLTVFFRWYAANGHLAANHMPFMEPPRAE